MRRIKTRKRLLTALVSMSLVFSGLPAAALAGGQSDESVGLCKHHPTHTSQCGYVREEPCNHEQHTWDCYTDGLICDDSKATSSDASADHDHTKECYQLDCPHRQGNHASDADDDGCGYAEAEPCSYDCDLCGEEIGLGNGQGSQMRLANGREERNNTAEGRIYFEPSSVDFGAYGSGYTVNTTFDQEGVNVVQPIDLKVKYESD